MTAKILTIFATRPEVVKLAPVINELEVHPDKITSVVCTSAQHREMVEPFLQIFNIKPNHDLNIMKRDQTLFDITANVLSAFREVLQTERPDIVLVQGDTTTAFAASLAAFYLKIKVGHVEAGLRSGDKYNPFPEGINRILIDHLSDFLSAPTVIVEGIY